MGAFLAALGAVLLFILRVIGILLLVVLILLVLLLLCPFCADLCWEHGVLTVKAGALGITFPVFQYPKPEPPPAPENPEPPRGFGKVKAKFAAWRAERKRKKAEEKARKKAAAAKANKPAQPRKKAKITLEILCTMLKGAGTLTKAVFGALRITKIQVRLGVRGEDPAAAARRELSEETGASCETLTPLGEILASPGGFTEVLHLYMATGLTFGSQHPDEDEFINFERVPFDALLDRCLSGELRDGKTVAGVLKVYALRTRKKEEK